MSVSDADSRLDDMLQANLVLLSDKLEGRAEALVTSHLEAAALCDRHDTLAGVVRSGVDSAMLALDGWLGEYVPVHQGDPAWIGCYDAVRAEALEQLETAACRLLGLARICSGCSAGVSRSEWPSLPLVGVQCGELELRNHSCGSTISLLVEVAS